MRSIPNIKSRLCAHCSDFACWLWTSPKGGFVWRGPRTSVIMLADHPHTPCTALSSTPRSSGKTSYMSLDERDSHPGTQARIWCFIVQTQTYNIGRVEKDYSTTISVVVRPVSVSGSRVALAPKWCCVICLCIIWNSLYGSAWPTVEYICLLNIFLVDDISTMMLHIKATITHRFVFRSISSWTDWWYRTCTLEGISKNSRCRAATSYFWGRCASKSVTITWMCFA